MSQVPVLLKIRLLLARLLLRWITRLISDEAGREHQLAADVDHEDPLMSVDRTDAISTAGFTRRNLSRAKHYLFAQLRSRRATHETADGGAAVSSGDLLGEIRTSWQVLNGHVSDAEHRLSAAVSESSAPRWVEEVRARSPAVFTDDRSQEALPHPGERSVAEKRAALSPASEVHSNESRTTDLASHTSTPLLDDNPDSRSTQAYVRRQVFPKRSVARSSAPTAPLRAAAVSERTRTPHPQQSTSAPADDVVIAADTPNVETHVSVDEVVPAVSPDVLVDRPSELVGSDDLFTLMARTKIPGPPEKMPDTASRQEVQWPELPVDATPVTRRDDEKHDDYWPSLPDDVLLSSESGSGRIASSDAARLHRLESEQRGELWNA